MKNPELVAAVMRYGRVCKEAGLGSKSEEPAEAVMELTRMINVLERDAERYAQVKNLTKSQFLVWRGAYGGDDKALDELIEHNFSMKGTPNNWERLYKRMIAATHLGFRIHRKPRKLQITYAEKHYDYSYNLEGRHYESCEAALDDIDKLLTASCCYSLLTTYEKQGLQ